MRAIKALIKGILLLLALPVSYAVISLLLTYIPVNYSNSGYPGTKTIYLSTNGVHLDIILAKKDINDSLLRNLNYLPTESYLSFGWGDENFYLNTPNWSDLTLRNAFIATFLKGPSLIHVTRYELIQPYWTEINISTTQLHAINTLLLESFQTDSTGGKILLAGAGYTSYDDFYKAHGSYSLFITCNSWVNTLFKKSGLKACLWTPYDFGLMRLYNLSDK